MSLVGFKLMHDSSECIRFLIATSWVESVLLRWIWWFMLEKGFVRYPLPQATETPSQVQNNSNIVSDVDWNEAVLIRHAFDVLLSY